MARSTHHPNYQTLLTLLRDLRVRAGITQLALAERLGNTQTFISKIERGERRIDVVEFIEICDALGVDPVKAFREYLKCCSLQAGKGNKLTRKSA
jgi:transcriptional regulator with XRE-family HTH domain